MLQAEVGGTWGTERDSQINLTLLTLKGSRVKTKKGENRARNTSI